MLLEKVKTLTKEDAEFIKSIINEGDIFILRCYPDLIIDETMAVSGSEIGVVANKSRKYRYVLISVSGNAKHPAGRLKVTGYGNMNTNEYNNTCSFYVIDDKRKIVEYDKNAAKNIGLTNQEIAFYSELTVRNWDLIMFCRNNKGLDDECMNAFIRDEKHRLNGIEVTRDRNTGIATYFESEMEKTYVKDSKGYFYRPVTYRVKEDIFGKVNREAIG